MNIVVDIETTDNSPTSAILSIGAASLNSDGAVVSTFYTPVSLDNCLRLGMTVGADTLAWWMEQDDKARAVWSEAKKKNGAPSLREALCLFNSWLDQQCEFSYRVMWGNGSDFDNVILANACKLVGMDLPWPFWNNRCFRTLKNEWGRYVPQPEFIGVKHNAKDDAVHEAVWLGRILQVQHAAMTFAERSDVISKAERI